MAFNKFGRRFPLPFSAAAFLMASALAAWPQVNLLPNGSFERRTSNSIPDAWFSTYGGTPTVLAGIATRCGDKVLRLVDSSNAAGAGLLSDQVAVTPGESYSAEAYIQRTDAGLNAASIYLKYYDSSGTNEVGSFAVLSGAAANVWDYVSVTGAAPANAVTARVLCYSGTTSTGTMYFDGVSLRRLTSPVNQLTRYVSPAGGGTATGLDQSNPVKYNNAAFWSAANVSLTTNAVKVVFLEGDYIIDMSADSLVLSYVGNDAHQLVLEGQHPFGSVFTRTDAAQTNDGPAMVHLQWVTNVVVRHLHWENDTTLSGRLVQYGLAINGANTGAETRSISVQGCSFVGLSWNIYGAMGFHHATTHGGQVLYCEFVTGGFSSGFHMIYNAYGAYDLSFQNNYFQDCTGAYLRLRGGCHEALVNSNTFVSTASTYNQPFVQLATFDDVDPGDETFGHNFIITNNLFAYLSSPNSVALTLYHSGFDPYRSPGLLWNYLLTPSEALTLTLGSVAAKKALLKYNYGLNFDTQMTLGGNVRQGYHAYNIQLHSGSAYGSPDYGGDGDYNISDIETPRPAPTTNSWLLDTNANWDLPTNWTPAGVPNGIGSVAILTNNLTTAPRTNTIDTAVTVGKLRIGSLDGATNLVIDASGGSALTMNNGGAGAEISSTTGSVSDSINAPIELADDLTITNTKTLLLRGPISELGPVSGYGEPRSLIKAGNGTLTLSGTNSFSGGLILKDGMVNGPGKIGTGPVMLGDTSGTNSPSLIGSGTYTNPITVMAGSTGVKTIRNAGTSAALTISGPITLNGDLLVNAGNSTLSTTLSGVLSGAGTLTTSGSSTAGIYVALTGANTFGGGVRLQSGTFRLGNDAALGTGTLSITNGTMASDSSTARALTNAIGVYGNFALGLASVGTGNLTLSGTMDLGAATRTVTVNNPGPDVIAGVISGAAGVGLVKAGTGTLTLSGGNAYGGDTTISAGTLTLGATNAIPNGSGKGNVSVTGTLDLNGKSETINGLSGAGIVDGTTGTPILTVGDNDATSAFSGVMKNTAGALSLTKVGTGKVTLSGTNTYAGGTIVSAGTLALVAPAGVTSLISNTPAIAVNAGATLEVSQLVSGFMLGGGRTLSGSGTLTGNVTVVSAGVVVPGGSNSVGTLTFKNALNLVGSTLVFDITNNAGNADKMVVTGSLTPSGVTSISLGNQTILANGSYPLIEVSGTLGGSTTNFSVASPTGGVTYTISYQTGTPNKVILIVASNFRSLTWKGSGGASSNLWDINTTLNWTGTNGSADVFRDNDAVTFTDNGATNPTVNLTTTVSPAATTVNSSSNYTFSGVGGLGGSAAATKMGTGMLSLATSNTFSGGMNLQSGTLRAGNNAALGTGPLSITSGTLASDSSTARTLTNPIAVNGNFTLGQASVGTGNLTLSGAMDLGAVTRTITVDNAGADVITGVISGAAGAGLIKAGTGSLSVNAASTYSGGATITAGTLGCGNASSLGTGSATLGAESGSASASLTGASVNIPNYITVAAGGTGVRTIRNNGTASTTFSGSILLNSNLTASTAAGGSVTLSGELSGKGLLTVSRDATTSANGVTLGHSNSFSGGVLLSAGTLRIGDDSALGTGTLTINDGTIFCSNSNSHRDPTNAVVVNGNFTMGQPVAIGAGSINFYGPIDLGAAPRTITLSNTVSDSIYGVISGTGGLTKVGAVALYLYGANTYMGDTTVSSGTLVVNNSTGSGTGSGNVTVQGGATLSVLGTISGNVTVESLGLLRGKGGTVNGAVTVKSGGNLAPGNALNDIGTLNLNHTLTLAAGSTTLIEIDRANGNNDAVKGVTALTYGGTLTVSNLGGTFIDGETYKLFGAVSYTNNFSATNLPALGGGMNWAWNPATGTLSVVSGGIASNPTNISYVVSGTNLTLTWPGSHLGWYAQSNSVSVADANHWFDIAGSEATTNLSLLIDPAMTSTFYRLRHP
jgi:autotransporter-associated beta strand protein